MGEHALFFQLFLFLLYSPGLPADVMKGWWCEDREEGACIPVSWILLFPSHDPNLVLSPCLLTNSQKPKVSFAAIHKLRVTSLLNDLTILQHNDVIREAHRRKAMRDRDRCAPR